MSERSLARRYASALFSVVRNTGTTEAAGRDLASLAALVSTHDELGRVLASPAVPPSKKRGVLEAVLAAAGPITPEVQRLALMLAERDRMALLDQIAGAFAELEREARRELPAEVVTASPLADATRADVAAALGRATGCTVTVETRVDPAIIGGLVARVGSVVYDASLIRQLEKMRQRLLNEQ
jgi:F-type H+-transporting ATPase subunit delta